ncbi:hypothetical protein ACNKHU_26365 [Shigella flexneri]
MLGDTAVAVNPEAPALQGADRPAHPAAAGEPSAIPIVADEHADMEKGTGCVKSPRPTTSTTTKWASAHNLPI